MTLLEAAEGMPAIDDLPAAVTLAGFETPPDCLWLTIVAIRAGLGLPGDPGRPRGWIRFGRFLLEDEQPAPGDVVVMPDGVGVLSEIIAGGYAFENGSGTVGKVKYRHVVTVRRPIILEQAS